MKNKVDELVNWIQKPGMRLDEPTDPQVRLRIQAIIREAIYLGETWQFWNLHKEKQEADETIEKMVETFGFHP